MEHLLLLLLLPLVSVSWFVASTSARRISDREIRELAHAVGKVWSQGEKVGGCDRSSLPTRAPSFRLPNVPREERWSLRWASTRRPPIFDRKTSSGPFEESSSSSSSSSKYLFPLPTLPSEAYPVKHMIRIRIIETPLFAPSEQPRNYLFGAYRVAFE